MRAIKPFIAITALLCAVAASVPAYAYGHGGRFRVGVGVVVGPGFGYGYYPYPYYNSPYYYNPYYYTPPVVMNAEPSTYVEQAAAPAQGGNYWYYCSEPEGYYPYVQQCRAGWQRVAPTPPATR